MGEHNELISNYISCLKNTYFFVYLFSPQESFQVIVVAIIWPIILAKTLLGGLVGVK